MNIPYDVLQSIETEEAKDPVDAMTMARAWQERMAARFGRQVWDQEQRRWLDWEQALSRELYGRYKEWLLGVPIFDEAHIKKALNWEFGDCWPAWCVKADLVNVKPCEFEDHHWRLVVDAGTRLVCTDPCEDPRVYCDGAGRYVFPACRNIPDCDELKFEIDVSPEWVYRDRDEWWVALNGETLQEKPWQG